MFEVICREAHQNSTTGYIEITVHSRKSDEQGVLITGPERTYGIDVDSLRHIHGGEVQRWLEAVKQEHQVWAGMHEDLTSTLHELKGKTL